jgi:conjugative relaxase-like TrwC/TraI family protein
MVTRPNKVFSATYFTDELKTARYFLASDRLSAFWLAGDQRFGVTAGAEIDPKHFENLFEGRDANGRSLLLEGNGLKKRVSAYELSVGVPKSVSAVWALANESDQAAIEEAFAKSLNVVADHVCRNAFTRLGHNGKLFVSVQPNIACFVQPDTRPVLQADGKVAIQPQIHAHLILPNIVAIQPSELMRVEGSRTGSSEASSIPLRYLTRSLDGHPLYHGAKSWGALQHLALATELQKLGYAVADIGKNGVFRLLPPEHEEESNQRLCSFWSARRKEIEDKLAESGLTTAEAPHLAAKAAVATRRAKSAASEDTFARWWAEAEALGIDVEHYAQNRRGFEMPPVHRRDAEIAARMAEIPRKLTEYEAVFDHHDLYREIASALVGTGVEVCRVDEEAEKLLRSGAILEIGATDRERIFSTEEMIRLEREVVAMTGRLARRPWHAIDRDAVSTACQAASLSTEQTAAALRLDGSSSIMWIDAKAGTGKTTTLIPICDLLTAKHGLHHNLGAGPNGKPFRVVATSVAWRTCRMLEQELGVEARALDSWLALARHGGRFCDDRTIVLVDESSQIGVRAMHALLCEVERGAASAVFLSDISQVVAVNAGSGIELVARTVEAAEITKIVRQSDPELRRMVELLAAGDVEPAIEVLTRRDCVVECDGGAATVRKAVDIFFDHRATAPSQTHLLICKSNATRLALDAEVRRRLRVQGVLTGDEVAVDAVTSSGRRYQLALAAGDEIRFGIRCAVGDGVINGTTARIKEVVADCNGHATIRADIDGKETRFSTAEVTDDQGRIRLATNYATTIWSSQGLTSDTATIVADGAVDLRDCYVALSRARHRSILTFDRKPIDLAIRADGGYERTASEITAEERRAYLVRQFSRWRVKSSTLSFVADEPMSRSAEQERESSARQLPRAISAELSL